MTVSLKFCGAAGTVTGSCYLIVHPRGATVADDRGRQQVLRRLRDALGKTEP